jgi:hypothetical protein
MHVAAFTASNIEADGSVRSVAHTRQPGDDAIHAPAQHTSLTLRRSGGAHNLSLTRAVDFTLESWPTDRCSCAHVQ